jgi:type I restriction enzyme, R subunit
MITEDQLEQLAIQWFQDTGWNYVHGAVIAPEAEPSSQPSPTGRRRNTAEREDFRAVVLKGRLAEAVRRLNPKLPESAVEEVVHVVTKPEHISLVTNNREFHRMLINGVRVEYVATRETYRETLTPALSQEEREEDCRVVDHALLIDFEYPSRNDFLVVSQFTVAGKKKPRRPDLVCFVNGLPLGLIELKNPADQQANVWKAFDQLQTYQAEISDLLVFNQALVVSDWESQPLWQKPPCTPFHSTKALKISANDLAPARMTLATRRGELRSTETMNGPWGSRHVLLKTWPTGFPCPIRGAERS